MLAVFSWWLIIEILALAALPLTYRLFKNLPDRGYAFAKPLGILLASYVLWIGASFGFLRNSWGGIVFSILVAAVGSWWFYSRGNREVGIASFLRGNRRMVIANEALFALAFVLFALFRAYNPEIMGTEKPMEFAFLNAILRSDTFPSHDPWLSGFGISYYYFGYLMMAMLTKLSGVASAVAFNLGITLLFALTVTGAYGLVYNLIEGRGNEGMRQRGKLVTSLPRYFVPLLGPLFVAILGNLEGVFEVLHAKGLGSARFWSWLDIKELVSNGRVTGRWFDLGSGWWWWRASRVIHDKDLLGNTIEVIDEFPFFSFMLGDMHPHVLALPFVLLALALALNVLRQKVPNVKRETSNVKTQTPNPKLETQNSRLQSLISNIQSPFSNLQHPLLYALCLGALAFINTWDFPIYLLLVAVAYGMHRYGHSRFAYQDGKINWALVGDVVYTVVGLALLGGLLYLPFYVGFQSQAGGILPNLFNPTRLHQYLIFFGPFVFVVIGFAALVTKRWRAEVEDGDLLGGGLKVLLGAVLLPSLLALGSIALIMFTARGQAFLQSILANEMVRQQIGGADWASLIRKLIVIRLGNPCTWLFLALLIAWIVALLWGRLRISRFARPGSPDPGSGQAPDPGQERGFDNPLRAALDTGRIAESSTLFVLLIIATGLLLTLSVEFVYLRDTFGTRMNTVFKFYYQAWLLLALASAYGVYYVIEKAKGWGRSLFLVGVAVLVALGMVYPLAAGFDKAGGFAPQPTLDGLAYVRQHTPDEYAAVQWLNENVSGTPVILEVTGGSFTEYARVSSRTGLPTVLGWGGHELQWRGNYDEPGRREPDINAIYSSTDVQHILTLLEKYGITYVYVGSLERGKYNPAALAKFDRFMDVAFQQGNVTIYERRP